MTQVLSQVQANIGPGGFNRKKGRISRHSDFGFAIPSFTAGQYATLGIASGGDVVESLLTQMRFRGSCKITFSSLQRSAMFIATRVKRAALQRSAM